jgi:hypothetical protein
MLKDLLVLFLGQPMLFNQFLGNRSRRQTHRDEFPKTTLMDTRLIPLYIRMGISLFERNLSQRERNRGGREVSIN